MWIVRPFETYPQGQAKALFQRLQDSLFLPNAKIIVSDKKYIINLYLGIN